MGSVGVLVYAWKTYLTSKGLIQALCFADIEDWDIATSWEEDEEETPEDTIEDIHSEQPER